MVFEQKTRFRIDLSDRYYKKLSKSAGRIAALLKLPKTSSNHGLIASLDDFLGAIYALIFARHYGFERRKGVRIEVDKVRIRADQIAMGDIRVTGKWMAGFHFNSALFRSAAVYHRILKVALGMLETKEYPPTLRLKAQKRYPTWTGDHVHAVYEEVNHLKHTPKGVIEGRTVDYGRAVMAVNELLDLIEAWERNP
jgi:hypothetical protein